MLFQELNRRKGWLSAGNSIKIEKISIAAQHSSRNKPSKEAITVPKKLRNMAEGSNMGFLPPQHGLKQQQNMLNT